MRWKEIIIIVILSIITFSASVFSGPLYSYNPFITAVIRASFAIFLPVGYIMFIISSTIDLPLILQQILFFIFILIESAVIVYGISWIIGKIKKKKENAQVEVIKNA